MHHSSGRNDYDDDDSYQRPAVDGKVVKKALDVSQSQMVRNPLLFAWISHGQELAAALLAELEGDPFLFEATILQFTERVDALLTGCTSTQSQLEFLVGK